MQDAKRKAEHNSLKFWTITWALLIGYLLFHTSQWDPQTPFITERLLRIWFILALVQGVYAGSSEWDLVPKVNGLQSLRHKVGYGIGVALYFLIVLAFYAGVSVGMLFALGATIESSNANADIDPVTIHSYVSPEANRYLLLIFFVIVTIVQTLLVGKPVAQWFHTEMERRLNPANPPTSPKQPDKPSPHEPDEQQSATPEARYFRTKVKPGGRVEFSIPELEVGQEMDVVVRPIKCRTGRERSGV